MRFLLGVLVGYSMRGKRKLLIRVLATVAIIVYIVLPAIALLGLHWNVKHQRHSPPVQIIVPSRY
jgi:chromate transport protein ChrA